MNTQAPVEGKTPLRICTVTPCHGRPTLVENLLKSLEKVTAEDAEGRDLVDFIIVDSTPENSEAAAHIHACCDKVGAYYLRGPDNVRMKRNLGARRAKEIGADIVLFIDSDCQAQSGLFREHRAAYQTRQSRFTGRPVGAATGVTRFVGRDSPAYRAAALTSFLDSFSFAEHMPEAPFAPCTNFSVRLDVFQEVGGFMESWNYRLGGDDTEFGRRLNNSGYAILSLPRAIVLHEKSTWSRWSAVVERVWRWGRMDINVRRTEPASNQQWIGPQPLPVALLLLPIALLWGIIPFLTLISSALILAPVMTTVLRKPDLTRLLDCMGAQLLALIFQLGSLYESVRIGRPWFAYVEIVTHPMQIATSWDARRRDAWVTVLMMIAWVMLTSVILNLIRSL